MYTWVLVAVFLAPDGKTFEYTVVDYYRSQQQCVIAQGQQTPRIDRKYQCLKRDTE